MVIFVAWTSLDQYQAVTAIGGLTGGLGKKLDLHQVSKPFSDWAERETVRRTQRSTGCDRLTGGLKRVMEFQPRATR